MTQNNQRWVWRLGLVGVVMGGAIALSGNCTLAQITPDGTLGAESSVVTPNTNIGGLPANRIDGGAARGTNLFHSFLEFNVGNGQRVYFTNPVGVENILSRVTGSNLSNILGTLGVDGGANLFLLNPNGIIFGSNAKLDIAGSFVASTADSIVFENGTKFSATNPEAPPLLKISITPGLQYGTNQPRATIANSGNLAVGQNLILSAGNLDLQGQLSAGKDLTLFAQDTVRIRDSVANPFMAVSGGDLLVQGNQGVDIFALNHPNSGLFSGGNMVLRSANTVGGDAHYWSGGSFRIEQLDGNLGSLYSPYDPIIASNGDVSLGSYTGASLHIFAGGSVTIPGTVEITGSDPITGLTDTVTLSNGETVSIDGESEPTLDVRAGIDWTTLPGDQVIGTIAPPLPVFGTIPTSADITIGNIITDIVGGSGGIVLLTNQYQPNRSLEGQIRVGGIDPRDISGGGSVFIDSRNGITLTGKIDNSLDLNDTGSSQAGNVTLLAVGDISLRDGGGIKSESRSDDTSYGYSVITIKSTEGSVFLNQAQLTTTNKGTGYAGNIQIDARDQVAITASSLQANGWAGQVTIKTDNQVVIADSTISSQSDNSETDPFSEINITSTEGSILFDHAQLTTTNEGTGYAGNIRINARDQVAITNGSTITSRGDLGSISIGNIITPQTVLIDGTQISTTNFGTGFAGDIRIDAREQVAITNGSRLFSNGWAGTVTVNAGNQVAITDSTISSQSDNSETYPFSKINITSTEGSILFDHTQLTTTNKGTGYAGNIGINAHDWVEIVNGSLIQSNGWAGQVTIKTDNQVLIADSTISSKSDNSETDAFSEITITSTEGSVFLNHAQLTTTNEGTGYAGDILIDAREQVTITNGSRLLSDGRFGRLLIGNNISPKTVVIESPITWGSNETTLLRTTTSGTERGGDISINTSDSISIINSSIFSDTEGSGNAGNISFQTNGLLSITHGIITSEVLQEGTGNGGTLNISANSLLLADNAQLHTDNHGQGNAGNISVLIDGLLSLAKGSFISSEVDLGAVGRGGNISITSESLALENSAYVTTTTAGRAGVNGRADAGSIEVNLTNSLSASGGSFLRSTTFGEGNAGNITIQAGGTVSFEGVGTNGISSGAFTFVGNDPEQGLLGRGSGGNIDINARSLYLTNRAQLDADTYGQGNAGNISVQANNSIALTSISSISSDTHGKGNAGSVLVHADNSISLAGSSYISSLVGAGAVGDGGNINIQSSFFILTDGASLSTETAFGGQGNAGGIDIQSRSLSLTNGATIRAMTWGIGNAGDIQVITSDFVTLSGVAPPVLGDGTSGGYSSGLLSSSEQTATGQGGNIRITTPNLRISDGAVLSTRSQSDFIGGNITIEANTLELTGGGQILTTAFSHGAAGDITVNSSERVTISGSDPTFVDRFNQVDQAKIVIDPVSPESGLFANTMPNSTGKGGSIYINSNQVAISNSAQVAVDSQGQGNGGNINIQTNSLTLNNRASIVAQTASGEGGNLTLQVQDILLMRYNSLISAEAGGTGNGGNIDLDAGFVVAVPKENSDIVANAFEGRGGNIDITTQGIFGIEFRQLRTPLSDITASSQFGVDGVVEINTPGVDPSRGLAPLPTNVVDPTKLIDRHCTAQRGTDERSSFTITGRGGLPSSPYEPLRNEEVEPIPNWVTVDKEEEEKKKDEEPDDATTNDLPTSSSPQPLVEAQGWVYGPNGEIILTADTPNVTPQQPWFITPSCPVPQTVTK